MPRFSVKVFPGVRVYGGHSRRRNSGGGCAAMAVMLLLLLILSVAAVGYLVWTYVSLMLVIAAAASSVVALISTRVLHRPKPSWLPTGREVLRPAGDGYRSLGRSLTRIANAIPGTNQSARRR